MILGLANSLFRLFREHSDVVSVDKLKKDGRKLALLLVANPEGELRFVTLNLQ